MKQKKIVVASGGTFGHVYPAHVLIENLGYLPKNVVWVGTDDGMEHAFAVTHGYGYRVVRARGLRGTSFQNRFLSMIFLMWGVLKQVPWLLWYRPKFVLCAGGYVSAATAIASVITRTPLVLQEQNCIAGTVNKYLARWAQYILCGLPSELLNYSYATLLMNPIRADVKKAIDGQRDMASKHKVLTIFIMGGSKGAKFFNDMMPSIAHKLEAMSYACRIVHQIGEKHIEGWEAQYGAAMRSLEYVKYDPMAYIEDIGAMYAVADMVFARAGAMTVSELLYLGKPCFLVPYPYAVDQHQMYNARYLCAHLSIAKCMAEDHVRPEYLIEFILECLDIDRSSFLGVDVKNTNNAINGVKRALSCL